MNASKRGNEQAVAFKRTSVNSDNKQVLLNQQSIAQFPVAFDASVFNIFSALEVD